MTVSTVVIWAGVILAGGAGSVLRFLIDRGVARRAARPLPFGTLTVNVTGAALLAFIGELELSREAALLIGTAFVGAYSTFSTWMLETQRLAEERQTRAALGNILLSVTLGLAAVVLAQWAAGQL
jgi:CrcB protein